MSGASVLPPSPVHLIARREAAGGLTLSWVRRSRQGWRWADGVDVPLVEESERYRLTLIAPGGTTSTIETSETSISVPAAATPIGTVIEVRQIGTAGESRPAITTLSH
ncbi:hypothetical protein ACLB0R_06095 [Sphingomonas sp. GlSt437]|uniref:hypothetical protein n=1 Tax=Sphingomonas sp. GlSt437 TaxID=3389970 RepID=UPI003A83C715